MPTMEQVMNTNDVQGVMIFGRDQLKDYLPAYLDNYGLLVIPELIKHYVQHLMKVPEPSVHLQRLPRYTPQEMYPVIQVLLGICEQTLVMTSQGYVSHIETMELREAIGEYNDYVAQSPYNRNAFALRCCEIIYDLLFSNFTMEPIIDNLPLFTHVKVKRRKDTLKFILYNSGG